MSDVNRPPWQGAGKEVEEKTAAEWLQEAAGDQGVRCPKCACPLVRVSWRRNLGGSWLRVRVCERCGQRIQTCESIERLLPPAGGFDISNQNDCIAVEDS